MKGNHIKTLYGHSDEEDTSQRKTAHHLHGGKNIHGKEFPQRSQGGPKEVVQCFQMLKE